MPRGYVGNVEYIGFGKYKCPDCGKTKLKKDFVSTRKGEETMSKSRCNSCSYKRYYYELGYMDRIKEQDPGRRKRMYDQSKEAVSAKLRLIKQRELEERIAELGITNEYIGQVTGMRRRRIQTAFAPDSRWSWKFMQEIENVVESYQDTIPESTGEGGDSELSAAGAVGESEIEEGEEGVEGYGRSYEVLQR